MISKDYHKDSKPTTHKGRLIRSFLEKKWHVFFDSCSWDYQYEPYPLPTWLPDFILIGKRKTYLVEVKPVSLTIELPQFFGKISKSVGQVDFECIFLGCATKKSRIGWLVNPTTGIVKEILFGRTKTGNKYDIIIPNNPLGFFTEEEITLEDCTQIWNYAGNQTQWRKDELLNKYRKELSLQESERECPSESLPGLATQYPNKLYSTNNTDKNSRKVGSSTGFEWD